MIKSKLASLLIKKQKLNAILASEIYSVLGNLVDRIAIKNHGITLYVKPHMAKQAMFYFKNHYRLKYHSPTELVCIDFPGRTSRFSLRYYFTSQDYNSRICIVISLKETGLAISFSSIFLGLDWLEREVWDMFGVFFSGHPNLRRILTDYGFLGYPLRKDFPLSGFLEVFYDDSQSRVIYEPVSLAQEYRNFDFGSAWLRR